MSEDMVEQRRTGGLGRGLSALLPSPRTPAAPATGGPSLREIPIDEIAPNPAQPRTEFAPDALEELAASIRSVGVLQPVVVRRRGAGYQLVMGERRVRAARLAGMRMIPAIVREVAEEAMLQDALIENLQREDLNPIEEAAALRQLVEEFALTHEDVAGRIGRSRAAVTNSLRLLALAPGVQAVIASGALSAAHGRAIAALADPVAQE
ncbi:MAG: ParB/RepB/Spo0J family partition protein, partial [Actinomycetota bacterium]